MDYLLTKKDGTTERWDAKMFSQWCKEHGQTVGPNFKTRLEQLNRYTNGNVVDWEMVESEK